MAADRTPVDFNAPESVVHQADVLAAVRDNSPGAQLHDESKPEN